MTGSCHSVQHTVDRHGLDIFWSLKWNQYRCYYSFAEHIFLTCWFAPFNQLTIWMQSLSNHSGPVDAWFLFHLQSQSQSWSINSVVYVFENCFPVFTSWNSQPLRLVAAWWALQMWRVTLFGLWPMLSMALLDVVYIFLVRLPNIHVGHVGL